jgi:hypothetical protein
LLQRARVVEITPVLGYQGSKEHCMGQRARLWWSAELSHLKHNTYKTWLP